MVVATLVSVQGTLSEVVIPSKTANVLEWLRKKLKQAETDHARLETQLKMLAHKHETLLTQATALRECGPRILVAAYVATFVTSSLWWSTTTA